jgi:transposase
MAPNLSAAQHEQLAGMIEFSALSDVQIAEQAGCSQRAVRRIRSNTQHFDSTEAPPNGSGRPSSITPPMLSSLCDHLLEKPTLYHDKMAEYLMAEFGGHVSKYAVRRALLSIGWSRKQTRRVSQERNADLRGFHLKRLSGFSSYHLVYVDESGCDKRVVGFRRTGR